MNRIDRLSTPRNLILAIIVSAVSIALLVSLTQTLVYDIYGEAAMPDLMLGYSYNDIMATFDSLGTDGLNAWLLAHAWDALFPVGYTLALVFGMTMLMRNTFPDRKRERVIVLIPIIAAIADYIENILIASQAISYPIVSEQIIAIASVVTIVKWLLLYVVFAIVFILLLIFIFKRIKRRKEN
ncbi:MAG: hypothetical protein ACTSUB_10925 [Candidatus Thorarchaeota archaeon]